MAETLPRNNIVTIETLASDLNNFLDRNLELETSVGKYERQAKYVVDNPVELYDKLSILEEIEKIERVYQIDDYVIPQGTKPTFQSEYLRLRMENFQESSNIITPSVEMVAYLTYQTTGEALSEDVGARTSRTTKLNEEQWSSAAEYLEQHGVSYREVKKDRTVFRYHGMTISFDQGVEFKDESGSSSLLGAGCFLEIMEDVPGSNTEIDELADKLGLKEPKITEPYANVDFFI